MIIVEEYFDAPVEVVWAAVTEHEHMLKWYFDSLPDFKAEQGFNVSFPVVNPPRTFTHNWEVVKVKEFKLISYKWNYDEYPGDSLLEMHITRHNEGCHFKLVHFVVEPFPDDIPEFEHESGVQGWNFFIHDRLKSYIETL